MTSAGDAGADPWARAALLTADAEAVQAALRAVERRAGGLAWAGPVREAFDDALRARLAELARAGDDLRAEADRAVREALRCDGAPPRPGSGWSP